MNIGEVLSRAWNIIWKNKVLWIFGLLASLAGGSGGNNIRYNLNQGNGAGLNIPAWALGLLLLAGLGLLVIFIIVSTLGRAGLVRGAWLADAGETGLTFSWLYREGLTYFGRVFLLGLLVFGVSMSLIVLFTIPAVLTFGLALVCLAPLLCVLVPFFIALTIVFELGIIAIVGEDRSVVEGLRRGWEVFRANLPQIIALGVVVVILSAVVASIAALPLVAAGAPLVAILYGGHISGGALFVALFFLIIFCLPLLLAVQAVLTSYVETVWTVAFRRVTVGGK